MSHKLNSYQFAVIYYTIVYVLTSGDWRGKKGNNSLGS